MAALRCIYTGRLDVIQPEKCIAHAAACSAPQQPRSSDVAYTPPDPLLGFNNFYGGVVSWSVIQTYSLNRNIKMDRES